MNDCKVGKFIVLEGGEGAGKTTCLTAIQEILPLEDFDVLCTREPGGSVFGEALRRVVLSHFMEMSPRTNLLLYCASRSDLIEKILIPARKRGQHIIYDRFDASTFAYQLCAQGGMDLQEMFEVVH